MASPEREQLFRALNAAMVRAVVPSGADLTPPWPDHEGDTQCSEPLKNPARNTSPGGSSSMCGATAERCGRGYAS